VSFDWSLFWQQTQNELIAALVLLPIVAAAFFAAYLWRRR